MIIIYDIEKLKIMKEREGRREKGREKKGKGGRIRTCNLI